MGNVKIQEEYCWVSINYSLIFNNNKNSSSGYTKTFLLKCHILTQYFSKLDFKFHLIKSD